MTTTQEAELPQSILTKSQTREYHERAIRFKGETMRVRATVRYDDQCHNGHNSFSITGEYTYPGESWNNGGGGCIHQQIAAAFPELAPLIKWHLCGSDGPMHYFANVIYHAGDRDCHGLLKGEFRQHHSRGHQNNRIEGVPNWVVEFPDGTERDVYAATKPAPVTLEWQPYGRTGEGKERELNHARSCAVWPDATDEELTAPGLKQRLIDRLPALMAEFKTAVESLGFTY